MQTFPNPFPLFTSLSPSLARCSFLQPTLLPFLSILPFSLSPFLFSIFVLPIVSRSPPFSTVASCPPFVRSSRYPFLTPSYNFSLDALFLNFSRAPCVEHPLNPKTHDFRDWLGFFVVIIFFKNVK